MNSLPLPGPSLRASMVPPCISTSRFTSDRPMPSPPCDRSSAGVACENISKSRGSTSAAMPMPVSRDGDHGLVARPLGAQPDAAPRSVYLAALFSRLANTWARRTGSASR